MYLVYRPTDECKMYWPDSNYVSFIIWRFAWLKEKPAVFQHWSNGNPASYKPDECWVWAYRYIPITHRLYWCEAWMGTNSTLFPFRALLGCLWPIVIAVALLVAVMYCLNLH